MAEFTTAKKGNRLTLYIIIGLIAGIALGFWLNTSYVNKENERIAVADTRIKAIDHRLSVTTDTTATVYKSLAAQRQAVSKELHKAAETPRANRGAAAGQSGSQPGENHDRGDGKKDEEPVIDAEVVEEPRSR